jgi:cell division protein FtsZ
MYSAGIAGVDFMVCNTDAQALEASPVPVRLQLGTTLTEGLGAGNDPERGKQAALENINDIKNILEGARMLFITAGMGGGTGTGAAPVIADLARKMDILTIAVVTVPAIVEGQKRFNQAIEGVKKLEPVVDSMLVINNLKLQKIYGKLPASVAFRKADNVICTAVKGVAEIITLHGNINIDFADVKTVLSGSKVFLMGTGAALGEERAMTALEEALHSPMLDSSDIHGAKDILLNIVSGADEITMDEVGKIIDTMQAKAGVDANIIWGTGFDSRLEHQISITVIATRFDRNPSYFLQPEPEPIVIKAPPPVEPLFPPDNSRTAQNPVPTPEPAPNEGTSGGGMFDGIKKIFGKLVKAPEDQNFK